MTYVTELYQQLEKAHIGTILRNEPLRNHCTWKIGGPADILVEPAGAEHINTILKCANNFNTPVVVIGEGSNLLFDDLGIRGLVLKIGRTMSSFQILGTRIIAESGVWVPALAKAAGKAGLSGLEHTIGIPGKLGGLILMNGGSQRKCIGDNIVTVTAIDKTTGKHLIFSREDCRFSYRNSIFQDSDLIITEAEIQCSNRFFKEIRAEMLEILRNRRNKFPRKLPNCGSVFISTPGSYNSFGPPGKMIEDAGLKGVSMGGAQVSLNHANFIINNGAAKSSEMLELIQKIRDTVHLKTGCWLECEVKYVNQYGNITPAHIVQQIK